MAGTYWDQPWSVQQEYLEKANGDYNLAVQLYNQENRGHVAGAGDPRYDESSRRNLDENGEQRSSASSASGDGGGGDEDYYNYQAASLAATVANNAAQQEYLRQRLALEKSQFKFEKESWKDEFAFKKATQKFNQTLQVAQVTGMYKGNKTWQKTMDEAGMSGYYKGKPTLDRQKHESETALGYMNLLSQLRGPRNAFQFARVLNGTPEGLRDIMRAAAGQYNLPGTGGMNLNAEMGRMSLEGLWEDALTGKMGGYNPAPGYGPGVTNPLPEGNRGDWEAPPPAPGVPQPAPTPGTPTPGTPTPGGGLNLGEWWQQLMGRFQNPQAEQPDRPPQQGDPMQWQGLLDRFQNPTDGTAPGSPLSTVTDMLGGGGDYEYEQDEMGNVRRRRRNRPDYGRGDDDGGGGRNDGGGDPRRNRNRQGGGNGQGGQPGGSFDGDLGGLLGTLLPQPGEGVADVSPPGAQAPASWWNYEPKGGGGQTIYPPGVLAPYNRGQYSTPMAAARDQASQGTKTLATSGLPLPNQWNARNVNRMGKYQRELMLAGYEDQGWDPEAAWEQFTQSLPTVGGPEVGTIKGGL